MAMRINRDRQREAQLPEQRMVAQMLLEYRVDDDRLASARVAQQIRIRRRRGIEQLAKDEVGKNCRPRSWSVP